MTLKICIVFKLILSSLLFYFGYYGEIGDATIYLSLAEYASEENYDLNINTYREFLKNHENYINDLNENEDEIISKGVVNRFLNLDTNNSTTLYIFYLSIFFKVFNSYFPYILLNCLITTIILFKILDYYQIKEKYRNIILFNPVSIYYSCTINKECLIEIITMFLFYNRISNGSFFNYFALSAISYFIRPISVLYSGILIIKKEYLFKYKYYFFILILFISIYIGNWDHKSTELPKDSFYNYIYYNLYTEYILGTIVGLLIPYPKINSLVSFYDYVIFFYSIQYWIIMLFFLYNYLKGNKLFNMPLYYVMIINVVLSFYTTGSYTKTRFFASFFWLLLLAYAINKSTNDKRSQLL